MAKVSKSTPIHSPPTTPMQVDIPEDELTESRNHHEPKARPRYRRQTRKHSIFYRGLIVVLVFVSTVGYMTNHSGWQWFLIGALVAALIGRDFALEMVKDIWTIYRGNPTPNASTKT